MGTTPPERSVGGRSHRSQMTARSNSRMLVGSYFEGAQAAVLATAPKRGRFQLLKSPAPRPCATNTHELSMETFTEPPCTRSFCPSKSVIWLPFSRPAKSHSSAKCCMSKPKQALSSQATPRSSEKTTWRSSASIPVGYWIVCQGKGPSAHSPETSLPPKQGQLRISWDKEEFRPVPG